MLLISAAVCLFAILVFGGSIIISSLRTSVYGINDLSENLDSVNSGDIINYDINGYSKWKVLTVDTENGTVEVTSKTSVKDLTIEPYKTVDEYNEIFQTEANKFNDGKYVINARTISKADSLTFDSDSEDEYWLANVNENTLMTNKTGDDDSSAIWTRSTFDVDTIYIIPFIGIIDSSGIVPDSGTELDYSCNGINKWIYSGQTLPISGDQALLYIPYYPVALHVDSMEDIGRVTLDYFDSFDTSNCVTFGNYLSKFPNNFHDTILKYVSKNIFDNQEQIMYFVSGIGGGVSTSDEKYNIKKGYSAYNNSNSYSDDCIDNGDYYDGFYRCNVQIYKYDTSNLNSSKPSKDVSIFYEPKTLTFGYRPVLTLKIDNESSSSNKSDINDSELNLGDYVSYEANDYKNWRVLSINRDNGTVDIISGGIVKNLSLYGKESYDNYESILQNEVDAYRNGDKVVAARAIKTSDVDLLINMKDKVESMYWFDDKIETKKNPGRKNLQTSSNLDEAETVTYGVGVLWTNVGDYYVNNGISSANGISKYYVKFYTENPTSGAFTYYFGNGGNMSFIAGLRPIITLKYDGVEKLSQVQARKLDKSSKDYDKYYTNEQLNNNFKDLTSGLLFTPSGDTYNSDFTANGSNSSSTDYRKVDVDMGETSDVLQLAVFLSIMSGLLIVGSATFLGIYKFKYVNKQ